MPISFPAKLLLFGEYTVIAGSQALAIPWPHRSGAWAKGSNPRQPDLSPWVSYLENLAARKELAAPLDLPRFRKEVEAGLWFRSDIPLGYGAGSSGALVAAALARFGVQLPDFQKPDGLLALKSQLAQMESFFHGASSGLDPLVSFVQRPIRVHSPGKIEVVTTPFHFPILQILNFQPEKWEMTPEAPASTPAGFQVFLLDTHLARQTAPLVTWFKKQREQPDFEKLCVEPMAAAAGKAIENCLAGNAEETLRSVRTISILQWEWMQPLIPPGFRAIWKEGLDSGDFSLKLCGAGGGGFLLGFGAGPLAPNLLAT